jgi:hypothetical protein
MTEQEGADWLRMAAMVRVSYYLHACKSISDIPAAA